MTDGNQRPATADDRPSRAGQCQTRAWLRALVEALADEGLTVSDLGIGPKR